MTGEDASSAEGPTTCIYAQVLRGVVHICKCRKTMTETSPLQFETDRGTNVTVTADRGTLHVDTDSPDLSTSARLGTHKGVDVLNCGKHRLGGSKTVVHIPVGDHKDDIEQLREESKSDEELAYEVVEVEKSTRTDGWGSGTVTRTELRANKSLSEMDDGEKDRHFDIDTEHDVPEDAETGDTLTPADILDDARTTEEKDQDALDEADETGEEVVISETTTDCNDSSKECNLDRVTRVATPDGNVETRRTHTY